MKRSPRRHGPRGGFSLIEVLITVALVGSALTALLGTLRTQTRSVGRLRSHQEARLLLEQAVERFQYGDGCETDSTIQGQHGVYRLSFSPAALTDNGGSSSPSPEGKAPSVLETPELHLRRVSVHWGGEGKETRISMHAWRFAPES